MPMTQTKAQELLTTYQEKLESVQSKLSLIDASEHSPASQLLSTLLKALPVIAQPSTASDEYSVGRAQYELKIRFNKQDKMSETTFAYLAKTYDSRAKALTELEQEIRKCLKMPSELHTQIKDGLSLKASPIAEVAPTVEENVIDWAFWLECGLLGVSFVASLALCVTAAITLNPVLLGVGVVATAVSGVALARTIGLFNPSTAASDMLRISEETNDTSSTVVTPS